MSVKKTLIKWIENDLQKFQNWTINNLNDNVLLEIRHM